MNYITINTPTGKTVWSKDLMLVPGVKIHLLNNRIADKVLSLFEGLDLSECLFPESVNECIGRYSLTENETAYNMLYISMMQVTRPNAVITGGDSTDLLY